MSASNYRPIVPITHHVYGQPISTLSFDPVSDTLWTGTNIGNVVAYYGVRGMRGVSFRVGGNLAVQKIIAEDSYVRAFGVSSDGIGSWTKGGMNKWFFRHSSKVTTFSNTSTTSPVVAVSLSNQELFFLNSMTGDIVRQVSSPSIISHLQFSYSHLISGASDGHIRLHDPRTGLRKDDTAESTVMAHFGGIEGLQCSGNLIFTIGLGMRQARPFPDPLVKVYDLRTLRALPPIAFPSGPSFINVIPKRSSCVAIISQQGLINIVDASNPNVTEFHQLDMTSYITSSAVSPTGAYLAYGDATGVIHLMTAAEEGGSLPFNGFEGQPIEWADLPEAASSIEWTDSTPLNSIGLPYYNTPLLSSWTPEFITTPVQYPPPQKIPLQILSTIKTNDNIAYAALPKELKGHRNMVVVGPRNNQSHFRSERSRKNQPEPETPVYDPTGEEIPRIYRHVEIEYSKFGVEDFDFGFYNKTEFSGLETHILNSYTNSLVQVMHYLHPIRRLAKSHITTNCPREHCLLCELGFVVRMLEDACGTNCHSTNFCKTVGVLAQNVNAIDIIDYGREGAEVDVAHKIQSFHRFLIDHLSSEGNTFPHNPYLFKNNPVPPHHLSPAAAPITQLLGIDAKNLITCMSCHAVREKDNMTHIVDMTYPRKSQSTEPFSADFATLLQLSLLRQMSHKATCPTCKQFAVFSSRRSIASKDLPPLLAVNTSVNNGENLDIWLDARNEMFLKPQIYLHGQMEGEEDPESVCYELRSMIVQIVTKEKRSHLVAIVKVSEAESRNNGTSPWFVFNDFLVRNVPEREALSFPATWKVPAIIYLERNDTCDKLDFSGLPDEIDTTILSRDTSISMNRDKNLIKHECLRFEELPTPGTMVAIDAEFVSMQQEETEFRSDGSIRVLQPARLSLARVSVLRGAGPKEGVPFIDDHIHTSELIVDYLTEYSGIKFGDLDPRYSPYTLTPLKLVYKKLRLLVDRGCIFIGHGLLKDFRIINIFVPPEQVIDTVDLYFLKARQRRLSLRFLSWFVLHENIQTGTHDSIEDAGSALKLYKAYQQFEAEGIFDLKLEELYREGRQYNWRPPESSSPSSNPCGTGSPAPHFSAAHNNLLQALQNLYPSSHSSTPVANQFNSLNAMYPSNWSQ